MNLAKFLTVAAVVAFVACSITFSMRDRDSAPSRSVAPVVIVTVTRDRVEPEAAATPELTVAPTAVAAAALQRVAASSPASPSRSEPLPVAVPDEAAVLSAFDVVVPSQPGSGAQASVNVADGNGSPLPAAGVTSPPKSGDPVEVDPTAVAGSPVQLSAGCGPGLTNCTRELQVTVGNGMGGAVVLGQGGGVGAAAASANCALNPKVEFIVNPDGSWTYTMDAGCVKKQGSSGR